jgi:hypothetical protein
MNSQAPTDKVSFSSRSLGKSVCKRGVNMRRSSFEEAGVEFLLLLTHQRFSF